MGVELVSIKEQIDTSTAMGRAMFGMIGVMAELERDMIRERTVAGLEAARARGRKGGRKPADQSKIRKALALYDSNQYSIAEITKETGVRRQRYINI
ncbi:recombinase family protein [Bacillus sp. DX4.1]|uniref:recombinase family protein n=1 Tax=Bacillus sp. DX4.1 TaxID=3055867 RepID=UPI0025A01EE0|nr:recombinase family protein [Bacillus sp. DX4.1]MDM5187556.1 recombinase family protein [Bacillus sp. DX4.1]